jgi:phosphoribosylformimino-5-aminoimidazole carboxamide ribotide isomerase
MKDGARSLEKVARPVSFTVFPSVDISDGRCLRPLQGRFGSETVYSDDPVVVALGFGRAGARWLHIVDLDGARGDEGANRDLVLEVVRKAACPVQAGGGLRSVDDVTDVLAAGANRAVMGTSALDDEPELRRACGRFGDRIVASLDARSEEAGAHWTVGGSLPMGDAVAAFESAGVSGFVFTDVGRDGSLSGPDVDGIRTLLGMTGRMRAEGVGGAIVGRALYEQKFSLSEAQHAADLAAAESR